MPFTFAHPAIVIPLLRVRKWGLSATGLVVGSVAPDFESFLTLGQDKVYGHNWLGVFWFDLPMAFLLTYVFHYCIKDALVAHLPAPWQQRCQHLVQLKWHQQLLQRPFIIVLSILIGILSHLLWDAFTHLNLLHPDAITAQTKFMGKRLYILLQYACSLVGQLYVLKVLSDTPKVPLNHEGRSKWVFWIFVALLQILILASVYSFFWQDEWVFDLKDAVNLLISVAFYALLIVSVVDRYVVNRSRYIR
jgi:hypothetical protein